MGLFHDGDLQSGITAAIQQQKLVVCFVFDDGDDSKTWETLLLELETPLARTSILLKIRLGSQEASFLAAFCPLTTAPSMVIIDNGRVVDNLDSSADLTQTRQRLERALNVRDTPTTTIEGSHVAAEPAAARATAAPSVTEESTSTVEEQAPTAQTDAAAPPQPDLDTIMAERAQRLAADQAAKRAEEKARRIQRAEELRKQAEEARLAANTDKGKGRMTEAGREQARTDWIREQSKRKQEAAAERDRILKQIESDRQERKHRTAMEKHTLQPAGEPSSSVRSTPVPVAGQTCALQVRLLDGSSMKTQLAATDTLADTVRTWIKDTAPSDAVDTPYIFRHLLAPLPSKTFDSSEEIQSLQELHLVPSATLVLVADTSKQTTLAGSNGGIFGYIYAVFASFLAMLSYVIGATSIARPDAGQAGPSSSTSATSSGIESPTNNSKKRTTTLAETRAEEDDDKRAEFYNGNSSAFESRKDD